MTRLEERNVALLAWYQHNKRPLPWRGSTNPWWILVSEVMSQQTQIYRVVPSWEAFIEAFPTPEACANSAQEQVLGLWSGLGYNSRAVRLQQAAAWVSDHGWPQNSIDLQQLPGVGPYTAAAVACLAFGEQVPSPDTNHKRVLSRWAGRVLRPTDLLAFSVDQLPKGQAAHWNQALMDLGASICRPNLPACDECPVNLWCKDPSIYEAPPKQGKFDGSVRQARGTIVRTLLTKGPQRATEIAPTQDPQIVAEAVAALISDAILIEMAGTLHLAKK